MELDKRTQKAICEALKLDSIRDGWHGDITDDNQFIWRFGVDYLWIAEILYYCPRPLVVAIAQVRPEWNTKRTVHHGLLLMDGFDRFLGADPLRHIVLNDYQDEVAGAMTEVNLFMPLKRYPPDGYYKEPQVCFYTYGSGVYGGMCFHGIPTDPAGARLWQALLATLMRLNDAYADPEINTILRQSPWLVSPEE